VLVGGTLVAAVGVENWFQTLVTPIAALAAFAAAIGLLYAFRERVERLVADLRISKIGALGVNIEFVENQTVSAYEERGLGHPSSEDKRKIREVATYLAPLAAGRRILWVDDRPEGNARERAVFREWRIDVQTRRATDDAMAELRASKEAYDLVISDWMRPGPDGDEAEEGLRLLRMMRDDEKQEPFVFYHGLVDREELRRRRAEAVQAGALGATGSPGELYRFVLLELVRKGFEETNDDDARRRTANG
jgi:CheY-like chemotaxis protein